jgi:hypothetical protein
MISQGLSDARLCPKGQWMRALRIAEASHVSWAYP